MSRPLPNAVAAMLPDLIEWRHDFHRNPELMYELPRTAGLVAERLRAFGFDEVIEGVGRTGILGILHGLGGPARDASGRVLFRADMDALPIREASGVAYASSSEGVMHACGHDGHTVMLLGAARALAETRAFAGTIVFCFQPAEEGGAGAQAMIDDGMLDRFPVKAAFALHNWPDMPVGHFGIIHGAAMASAGGLLIRVEGVGGHAAQPHKARDPVVAAAEIVLAAQGIVARRIDPLETAVISITSIHGGEAWNVIPDRVDMKANFRAFNEDTAAILETELKRICAGVAKAHGMRVVAELPEGAVPYPPTVNHPKETMLAIASMRAVAGADRVRDDIRPVTGSEDFAFILREVPGAYGFIGNGASSPLHHPGYDFNDEAIGHGVAFWCDLALRCLPPVA
jgi:hippurate hydrolase